MLKYFAFILLSLNLTQALSGHIKTLALSQSALKQGEVLRVDLISSHPLVKSQFHFNKKNHPMFKLSDTHYVSYIGMSRYLKPNTYTAYATAYYKTHENIVKYTKVTVTDADFKESKITFTGKKKTLSKDRSTLSTEAKEIASAFKTKTPTPYFTGAFLIPAIGKITSPFGAYRSYNGRPTGKHSGLDLGNKTGTPINATQHGKVILSKYYKVHGHSIIIDHGLGILSIYNHMNERLVTKGDIVKKGQIIGKMGETGIATGPHLHWGISILNERVSPLTLSQNQKLFKNP